MATQFPQYLTIPSEFPHLHIDVRKNCPLQQCHRSQDRGRPVFSDNFNTSCSLIIMTVCCSSYTRNFNSSFIEKLCFVRIFCRKIVDKKLGIKHVFRCEPHASVVSFIQVYFSPEGNLVLIARDIADMEISIAGSYCIISESEIDGEWIIKTLINSGHLYSIQCVSFLLSLLAWSSFSGETDPTQIYCLTRYTKPLQKQKKYISLSDCFLLEQNQ